MAGTNVKYPMRMMQSSVAMFFMIDQLSLLRPEEERVLLKLTHSRHWTRLHTYLKRYLKDLKCDWNMQNNFIRTCFVHCHCLRYVFSAC